MIFLETPEIGICFLVPKEHKHHSFAQVLVIFDINDTSITSRESRFFQQRDYPVALYVWYVYFATFTIHVP